MSSAWSLKNTPLADVDVLTQNKDLHPPRQALAIAQHRLSEKALFDELEIPVAPYKAVTSVESLQAAVAELGLPIVLKPLVVVMTVKASSFYVQQIRLIRPGRNSALLVN